MSEKIKVLILKFIKSAVSGAVAMMAVVLVPNITTILDFKEWLFALSLAGAVGFVNGIIQAGIKYFTWKTDEQLITEAQSRIDNK